MGREKHASGRSANAVAAKRTKVPPAPRSQARAVETPVASDEPVTVSAIIGTGSEAHRLVRVGAWDFTVWESAGDNEPRVRAHDAGVRLGFGRGRDIFPLIRRTFPGEKLKQIHVRDTVSLTSMPNGGVRQDVDHELWLTEAQLLKVIARSETEIAESILDDIIRVYMLARRGLLPSQQPVDVAALLLESDARHERAIASLESRQTATIAAFEERQAGRLTAVTAAIGTIIGGAVLTVISAIGESADPHIGAAGAERLSARIAAIAEQMVVAGESPTVESARSTIEQRVRRVAKWGGDGATFATIKKESMPDIDLHLGVLEDATKEKVKQSKPKVPPGWTEVVTKTTTITRKMVQSPQLDLFAANDDGKAAS